VRRLARIVALMLSIASRPSPLPAIFQPVDAYRPCPGGRETARLGNVGGWVSVSRGWVTEGLGRGVESRDRAGPGRNRGARDYQDGQTFRVKAGHVPRGTQQLQLAQALAGHGFSFTGPGFPFFNFFFI